jgi:hypothetical protein
MRWWSVLWGLYGGDHLEALAFATITVRSYQHVPCSCTQSSCVLITLWTVCDAMSQTTTERTPSHTADSAQLGHLEGVLYRRGYEVKMMMLEYGLVLGLGCRNILNSK